MRKHDPTATATTFLANPTTTDITTIGTSFGGKTGLDYRKGIRDDA